MRVLDEMCEILEDELKDITKKGDISPAELESVYKSVDIIKDIETIKAMKESGGYSNASYNSYDGSYEGSYGSYRGGEGMSNAGRRGRDGDSDGRYSERRGRDAMGRYTSRDDGYGRENETENLRRELAEMRKKLDRIH